MLYLSKRRGPQKSSSARSVPRNWYMANGTQVAPVSMKPQRRSGKSSGTLFETRLRKATTGGMRPWVKVWLRLTSIR